MSNPCWKSANHHQDEKAWKEVVAIEMDLQPVRGAISNLKDLFCGIHCHNTTIMRKAAEQMLNDVISSLQKLLCKHPSLCTTHVLTAVRDVLLKIKGADYESANIRDMESDIVKSVNQLLFACSRSVSEYSNGAGSPLLARSRSLEILQSSQECSSVYKVPHTHGSQSCRDGDSDGSDDLGRLLMDLPDGVDKAFGIAHRWLESSELMCSYIERRNQLVSEFAKNLAHLTRSVDSCPSDVQMNRGVFACAVKQDAQFAESCLASVDQLEEANQIQLMRARQKDHLRIYEELKAKWDRQRTLMENDASDNPIHAHLTAKKLDIPDYVKLKTLSTIHELIRDSENVAKKVVVNYCSVINALIHERSLQLSRLSDGICKFEPRTFYLEYYASIGLLTVDYDVAENTKLHHRRKRTTIRRSRDVTKNRLKQEGSSDNIDLNSSYDFGNDHEECLPLHGTKNCDKKSNTLHGGGIEMFYGVTLSDAAQSHKFQKSMALFTSCRQCGATVMVQGVGCIRCGLTCHKKCLPILRWNCGGQSNPSVNRLPKLVARCIYEIEDRAIEVKGIYRVSAVKSAVDSICQKLQENDDQVDLSSLSPHVVTGILKSSLRQIILFQIPKQPVETSELYSQLVHIVQNENKMSTETVVAALKKSISSLPLSNFVICTQLIRHLKRVADHSDVNQMTASNLSLVFGPTLFGDSSKDSAPASSVKVLSLVADHCRIVELLIRNAKSIFGEGNRVQVSSDQCNENSQAEDQSCA